MTVAFAFPGGASPGAIQVLGLRIHATSLLVAQRFAGEVTTLTGSRAIILPPPCPIRVAPIDSGHAEALIVRAPGSAGAFLDDEPGRVVGLSRARRRPRPPHTGRANGLLSAG